MTDARPSTAEQRYAEACQRIEEEWANVVRPTLEALGFFDVDLTDPGD